MTHKYKFFPTFFILLVGTVIALTILSVISPLRTHTRSLKPANTTSEDTSNTGSSTTYNTATLTTSATSSPLPPSSTNSMIWAQIASLSGPSAPEDESELNSTRNAIGSLLLEYHLHTLNPHDHPIVETDPPLVYECDKSNNWTLYTDAVSAMSHLMLKENQFCLGNWTRQECMAYVTWGTARIERCPWHIEDNLLTCGEVVGYALEVVEACRKYRGVEGWGYSAGWRVLHTSPKGHESMVYVH
ncbi:hypothetical protein HOY80DRAFT_1005475 [Tuber brumale]|nr:hypothetical protein HOY80DRAFT_1005475 [Tuber brumale]